MRRISEIINSKNIDYDELLKRIDLEKEAMELIDKYKVLPTPEIMKKLEQELGVGRLQIYSKKELQLLIVNTKFNVSDDYEYYHIHIRLPRAYKEIFKKENLRAAGYKSLNDWFMYKTKSFIKQLKYVYKYKKEKSMLTGKSSTLQVVEAQSKGESTKHSLSQKRIKNKEGGNNGQKN